MSILSGLALSCLQCRSANPWIVMMLEDSSQEGQFVRYFFSAAFLKQERPFRRCCFNLNDSPLLIVDRLD